MHALITGANRGIGAGLYDGFTQKGWSVTGTARQDIDGLEALEVTNPDSHRVLAERLDGKPIDLLVCNAGVYRDKGHRIGAGYSAEDWAETFSVNVTGVFLTVEALLGNLQAAEAPKIALISSMMASHTRAPGGSYIYRASKAAVLNLGRNLSSDFKGLGIAVGIYHPGWVSTDMGGESAPVSVDQAVTGLMSEFDRLSMDTTGCFRTFDGEDHAY